MFKEYSKFSLLDTAEQRIFVMVLVSSIAGLLLNLYPIHLFADMTLIFGPAFSILIALSIGPWWGALTAAIVSSTLIYSWGHYYGFLLFTPEAFVIGLLYRKGWNELLAVFIYWLVVAIPFVVSLVFFESNPQLAVDLTSKYIINSFLYTLIASAMLWGLSVPNWLHLKSIRSYNLRNQIFTILMVSMTLPIAAISLYEGHLKQQKLTEDIQQSLQAKSERIASGLDRLIVDNQLVLENHAKILSLTPAETLTSFTQLNLFHQQLSQFISILIAAPDGSLHAFSSLDGPVNIEGVKSENISDRDYFNAAVKGNTFISQAFKGRAKGDPIITISTPIRTKDNKIIAILAGSLNLYKFDEFIADRNKKDNGQLLVLDKDKKVIHYSDKMKVSLLQEIDWKNKKFDNNNVFFTSDYYDGALISAHTLSNYNWHIYTLYPLSEFNILSRENYHQLVLVLIVFILIVSLLAFFLSYQLNSPIQLLLKRIVNFNVSQQSDEPVKLSALVPEEILNLIRAHESAEKRLRYAFQAEQLNQQKRINAEKASEAKSNFLSAMSHELRTPLNAISGFSQLLSMEESLSNESKSLVSEINIASQHLMLLINDVLDMSKIESEKLVLTAESVNVVDLFRECLPLLESQAKVRNIEIILQLTNENIFVLVDPLRLKQVIINLLSNAIKYNRAGGKVEVSFELVDEQQCAIKIKDTGIGIAAERLSELFQKFNRLDKENSNIEGYGIGLLISKRLIELMDGEIKVESELGEGSCFSLCLPIKSSENEIEENVQITEIKQKELAACNILYIEDNEINAMVMKTFFKRFPQVSYHHELTGQSGLTKLAENFYDFVLLDISLPDMNGFDIFDKMKKDLSEQFNYVFAVSANALSEDIDKGLAAGMDEYVTKPIKFELLFELIQTYQQKN